MRPAADALTVEGVSRTFVARRGIVARLLRQPERRALAVDRVSLAVPRGTTFGLVGESGCGKSTLARIIAGLVPPDAGRVVLGREAGRPARLQMIFQDPFSSLNPRWRVGRIIAEPIRVNRLRRGADVGRRVEELLRHVKLSPRDAERWPHEFSGGQRQRISIARALAGEPSILVCDEPTSALDVSVQAQILNLIGDLQTELGLTVLFITHNLAVVRRIASHIGVMYLGQIVEVARAEQLFRAPRHPYTRLLIDAALDLDTADRRLHPIAGELPSPAALPPGCRFATRCPQHRPVCDAAVPPLVEIGPSTARCLFPLADGAVLDTDRSGESC